MSGLMHKVIIDTDPGIDDAQAIAFAVAHPNIELVALTTVFGNADVQSTTRNALSILDAVNLHSVPVARGAGRPLIIERLAAPDFVHGGDGLGNLALPDPTGAEVGIAAHELLVEIVNSQPGEISLVAIGPLTNLALAIELDPELPSKVKQLVIMGGSVAAPGNVSPIAEANFINDPHAADIVLGAGWPLTLLGLDVTMQIHLFDSDLRKIKNQNTDIGQLIWDSSRHYVDFYKEVFSQPRSNDPCTPMHDATALVYLLEPALFELESGAARVVCDGMAMGQLALDRLNREYFLPYWQDRPTVSAATQLDSVAVKDYFVDTMLAHPW